MPDLNISLRHFKIHLIFFFSLNFCGENWADNVFSFDILNLRFFFIFYFFLENRASIMTLSISTLIDFSGNIFCDLL